MTSRRGGLAFFDSNIPLYLLSADAAKASRAEDLLAEGGVISVQVLNEVTAVARRKHRSPWPTVHATLTVLRQVCRVEPVTVAVHDHAITLAQRHGMPIYDACIVASALAAACDILYSEDFQQGQVVEGMTIRNPFA